ncbi:MAG: hypothetical protein HY848_19300 [Betaproteobacteria bacterium]|nr:hypothetical protein [Betaproteobacteria bacterium]
MRQPELNIKRARGFLLIVAVVVLVLVAVAVVALGNMTSADIRASSGHAQSEQAYFVATSGIEYASQQFGAGTQCANLTNTNIAVGAGTFATSGVRYTPARTTLSAAIGATSTTIPVASIAGYAPRGQVRIDNEYINYASASAVAGICAPAAAPCLLNAQRAASGSTAAAHVIATPVAQTMCVVTSTGAAGGATRVLQQGIRLPGAMVVYAKLNGDRVPYYRMWDGTAWGAERTATSVGAVGNIDFMVLKFSRTRNEAVLGVQSSTGAITTQIWNGSAWSAVTAIGTAAANYRGFDLEYEQNNDRALIVYHTNVAAQFSYRTLSGTTWSAATNVALPVGFGTLRWIELAPNPLGISNDMALILTNNGVAGAGRIYGLRWTGNAWNNMGAAAAWDTVAANTTTKIIDVAYEQQSGDILFVWGRGVTTQPYRSYSGGALGAVTVLTMGDQGGAPNWLRLAPDPTSNRIMYAATDTGSDLNTRMWTGAAWDCSAPAAGACNASHPEHSAAVEDIQDMNFDIVFETHPLNPGIAWLVFGDGATVSRRRWNSGTSTWAAATTSGDDTAYVALAAHPFKDSGAVFAAIYEDTQSATDDIRAMQLTAGGVAWSVLTQLWAGATVANPVRNRVAVRGEQALVPIYGIEVYP